MRNKSFLFLLSILLLSGCNQTSFTEEQKETPINNSYPIQAVQDPVMFFEQSEVATDQKFTVSLLGNNLKQISGISGKILFDPAKLQVLEVRADDLPDFLLSQEVKDNQISFALAAGGSVDLNQTAILNIQFLLLQEEKSSLTLSEVEVVNSQLNPVQVRTEPLQVEVQG